jgi:hypothetical protein
MSAIFIEDPNADAALKEATAIVQSEEFTEEQWNRLKEINESVTDDRVGSMLEAFMAATPFSASWLTF